MWNLIDYKTHYYDNGCDVQSEEQYLLKNNNTSESKWVDEYDYRKMKNLGLVK
jgi:hypothetical protein